MLIHCYAREVDNVNRIAIVVSEPGTNGNRFSPGDHMTYCRSGSFEIYHSQAFQISKLQKIRVEIRYELEIGIRNGIQNFAPLIGREPVKEKLGVKPVPVPRALLQIAHGPARYRNPVVRGQAVLPKPPPIVHALPLININ